MKNFKQWFLPAILILGLFTSSCSSSSDDDSITPDPDPTPSISRTNTNVTLSTEVAPSAFTTKILLEDYTGTWCGYCPRVAHAMEDAVYKNSNVIGIGIHDDSDMGYTHVKNMLEKFNITGFPTAKVNRLKTWTEKYNDLQSNLSKDIDLGIALLTDIENEMVKGKIQIGFSADISKSVDYVIYLVEDKVVANQANYYNDESNSPYYQKGNPIIDFEHANVLRKSATDVYGDVIPEDYTKAGKICEADFEISLENYKKENCYIVAFVVEKGGKNVLNAQIVKIGSNQAFD